MSKLVIIGGGAAGMMAAISYRHNGGKDVLIVEKNDKLGRKIYATGNGRGNFTHEKVSTKDYIITKDNQYISGTDDLLIEEILSSFTSQDAISFFKRLGVFKREEEGRIYPMSNQAAVLVYALEKELEKLGVPVIYDFSVEDIQKREDDFLITGTQNGKKQLQADQVMIAAGGKASPNLGSSGDGFTFLKQLGHRIEEVNPGLTAFKTKKSEYHSLKGVRIRPEVKFFIDDQEVFKEEGEVLFTDYGLSGIVTMNASNFYRNEKNAYIVLDVFPSYTVSELREILEERKASIGHWDSRDFLSGIVEEKLSYVLMEELVENKKARNIKTEEIEEIAKKLKGIKQEVIGVRGFNHSQISLGGASLDQMSGDLESLKFQGLFIIGEALDISGLCGGFNLHMAWATGHIAGKKAANN